MNGLKRVFANFKPRMKLLRETLELELSLPKHKANKHNTRKTIGCLYQFTNIKTEFKEIKDIENAHRDLYWFTLNTELHPVLPETTGESTKQSTLDYLQHNQRSDLDPLKNTQHFSTIHTKFLSKYKGLHLSQKRSEINTR